MSGDTQPSTRPQRRRAVLDFTAVIAMIADLCGSPISARADFQVRSPLVDYREFEFEHKGAVTFDRRPELNRDQSYTHAVGFGVTPFWKIELEAETGALPDGNLRYLATTVENTFQLTPQGKYWADYGLFVEYSHGAQRGSTNTVKAGPIVQKETFGFGPYTLLHTVNLFFEREVGPFGTDRIGFLPALQSRLRFSPFFEPGIEAFGGIEDLQRAGKYNYQQYNVGPMFAGGFNFAPYGKIKYELGYLFGLSPATPRGAVRWLFEYEISF